MSKVGLFGEGSAPGKPGGVTHPRAWTYCWREVSRGTGSVCWPESYGYKLGAAYMDDMLVCLWICPESEFAQWQELVGPSESIASHAEFVEAVQARCDEVIDEGYRAAVAVLSVGDVRRGLDGMALPNTPESRARVVAEIASNPHASEQRVLAIKVDRPEGTNDGVIGWSLVDDLRRAPAVSGVAPAAASLGELLGSIGTN